MRFDFVIVLLLCCCCVVVVLFDVLLLLLCSCHFVIVSYCCMDCSDKLISVCVKFFYKVADRQTEPLLEVLSDLKTGCEAEMLQVLTCLATKTN